MNEDTKGCLRFIIVGGILYVLYRFGKSDFGKDLTKVLDELSVLLAIILLVFGASTGNIIQILSAIFTILYAPVRLSFGFPSGIAILIVIGGFILGLIIETKG